MNWISVEDSLPKPYTDVLFVDDIGIGYGYVDHEYDWYWFSSSGKTACKNVAHWQPLPEPPSNEPKEETVTILKKYHNWLLNRNNWLVFLEEAGVDNWQGIDYAYELKDRFEEEE